MKKFDLILISTIVLLFLGCNQENSTSKIKMVNDTYHQVPTGYRNQSEAIKFKAPRGEERDNQIAIAKIKAQEKLELAKIDAITQAKVKRIEVEALKAKAIAEKEAQLNAQKVQKEISTHEHQTQKEIATSNQKIVLKTQEKDLYLYKIITAVIGFIVLMGILVAYLINRENRIVKVKLEEDRIKHEEFKQANNQYHEKTNKILDIIADANADENIKRELVNILSYQEQSKNQILIEHPSSSKDGDNNVEIIEESDNNREADT